MADAYGGLVTCISEDCVIDGDALAAAMNEFDGWCSDAVQWKYCDDNGHGDELIYPDGVDCSYVQYPSVDLREIYRITVEDQDGAVREVLAENASGEDWDNVINFEYREITLATISNVFAPHIKSGWFEIACSSNEKMRYVEFLRLRIYADGRVVRKGYYSSPFWGYRDYCESFHPATGEVVVEEDKGHRVKQQMALKGSCHA